MTATGRDSLSPLATERNYLPIVPGCNLTPYPYSSLTESISRSPCIEQTECHGSRFLKEGEVPSICTILHQNHEEGRSGMLKAVNGLDAAVFMRYTRLYRQEYTLCKRLTLQTVHLGTYSA